MSRDPSNPFAPLDNPGWLDTAEQQETKMTDVVHPAPAEFTADEISIDPILRFFHYAHLPPVLQARSKLFCDLARFIFDTTPRSAERTMAFRKLLEAKDCAVRATL